MTAFNSSPVNVAGAMNSTGKTATVGPTFGIRPFSIVLAAVLQGCAMSGTIRSDAVSYQDVIEDTTDQFLLANILRARDLAPLHFVDIATIHETLQSTASVTATIPFGARNGSTNRDGAASTLSLQASPSFDVSHLNTKDFVTGIASPIDAKFIKYWLDRGLDHRIVLLLFISSADIVLTSGGQQSIVHISNTPRAAIPDVETSEERKTTPTSSCKASDFSRFLALINDLRQVRGATYVERTQIGDDFPLDLSKNLKDVAGLDFEKFTIEAIAMPAPPAPAASQAFRLLATSPPKVALCFENGASPEAVTVDPRHAAKVGVCSLPVITHLTKDSMPGASPPSVGYPLAGTTPYCDIYHAFEGQLHGQTPQQRVANSQVKAGTLSLRFNVRSVGEIIQYLGDLLAYQEALQEFTSTHPVVLKDHHVPVTLGYCDAAAVRSGTESWSTCDGGVLFTFSDNQEGARFGLLYRDRKYFISEAKPTDHSLEVLSVVHRLIDLNKSASDIRATPLVQVVP